MKLAQAHTHIHAHENFSQFSFRQTSYGLITFRWKICANKATSKETYMRKRNRHQGNTYTFFFFSFANIIYILFTINACCIFAARKCTGNSGNRFTMLHSVLNVPLVECVLKVVKISLGFFFHFYTYSFANSSKILSHVCARAFFLTQRHSEMNRWHTTYKRFHAQRHLFETSKYRENCSSVLFVTSCRFIHADISRLFDEPYEHTHTHTRTSIVICINGNTQPYMMMYGIHKATTDGNDLSKKMNVEWTTRRSGREKCDKKNSKIKSFRSLFVYWILRASLERWNDKVFFQHHVLTQIYTRAILNNSFS